jgi:hypothetical protein
MLTNIVLTALQVCKGTEYHVEGLCKSCVGTRSGYDTRTKQFAILCDDEDDHTVEVFLHRSYCLTCRRIWLPEEPFYRGALVGCCLEYLVGEKSLHEFKIFSLSNRTREEKLISFLIFYQH